MRLSQDAATTRQTILSYLDDYLRRGRATMLVGTRGLRRASWSYERVVLTARRVARELEARGVARGARVLLWGENNAEWVAAFWGCLLRGAVVVPLDKESSPEFVRTVVEQTNAALALLGRSVHAPEDLETPRLRLDELEAVVAHHSSEPYTAEGTDADSLVEIIYTSGTTQTPKGVLLTHRNLLANLEPLEQEIAKYLKWERMFHPIRFLNLVPLSHVFGQFMGIFVPQLLGGEVHFQDSLNPAEIVRRTREERISVIVLVPRLLEGLREWVERDHAARGRAEELKRLLAAAGKVKFWRRWWMFRRVHRRFGYKFWAFLSGGATLDEETDKFWRRLGFAVLQGYGMTETASLISVNHPFKQSHGSIGKLMPGYEVKLDETGEIIVRGPSVSPGYWSSARGDIDAHAGGWLRTGDLGEMDAAGNLYFKGRKKDVIVTAAGLNVYPEDLEAALNREPEVRLSCVIAWEGARSTEPLAVLILRDEGASAESVVERANRTLAEHQRIRRWFVWDEPDFPRTATRKVIKREVAATVSARMNRRGEATESDARAAREQETGAALPSRSFIVAEAARLSGSEPARLDPSANLATDLKLDSLGRVELLSALEDRYQIEIDEAAFTAATTVEEVEKLVRGETTSAVRATPYPFPRLSRTAPLRLLRSFLFYTIILPITRVMSRMRVEGREHLDELNTPALFVANHVTLADQALVLAALPARLRGRLAIAMEGERLRDWLHPQAGTSLFTRLRLRAQYILVTTFFNVFPLPKQSGFRRSFAYAGACVERGESVLVFPEGERARRGQMHLSPFKTGIGVLAQELSVPVVPVKLHGLYELKRRKQYFASPGQVTVVFGAPVRFDARTEPALIAAELQRRVAEL
ncbi:MAG TPA: AMP-binding protein [Pyrinomonadaceae bacterium]|jgi:long-chain acyl-CoA synthetase